MTTKPKTIHALPRMSSIRSMTAVFGISLLLGITPVTAAEQDADPACGDAAAWLVHALGISGEAARLAEPIEQDNISGGEDSMIEEYLSFHAQAVEENGKFSLMPWSGLRTHAN